MDREQSQPQTKKWSKSQWILGLLGIVAGLFAAEYSGRWILAERNWTPGVGLSTSAMRVAETGIHGMKPDLDTYSQGPWQRRVPIHTDELGRRIPRRHREQPHSDQFQEWLIVGASNTWGMGVKAESSWPFAMEAALNAQAGGAQEVRVRNLAQPGLTIVTMLATLKDALKQSKKPSKIIMALPATGTYMLGVGSATDKWDFDDFGVMTVIPLALEYDLDHLPELELVNGWVMWKERFGRQSFIDAIRTESCLGQRMLLRLEKAPLFAVDKSQQEGRDQASLAAIAARSGRELFQFAAYCQREGIPLHMVTIPADWKDMAVEFNAEQTALFVEFLKNLQLNRGLIDRIDLVNDPRYQVDIDPHIGIDYLADGRHLSTSGHRKVAAVLTRYFLESK